MREFRDGAAWTASATGFRCENQLFEAVRDRRPKPSTWRPGAGADPGETGNQEIPTPYVSGGIRMPEFESFAANPISEDADGMAARFRAIAAAETQPEAVNAAERLDEALRRLKSERP